MAEVKTTQREYVIPLRRECLKVPYYERTARAIKAIKKFIVKHMKVPERDLNKVKLDVYFNNNLWFRGRKKPPTRVKVRAVKEDDVVKVSFVEVPEYVKFLKAKHEKKHKKAEKPKPIEKPAEEKPAEKTEEEKKEEEEKGKSVEAQHKKEFKEMAKQQKHVAGKRPMKGKQPTEFRKALKK
jgi:large subunit ribosomal protein L31e